MENDGDGSASEHAGDGQLPAHCAAATAGTGLPLVSSVMRMILYIDRYGMTTLRTVVMLCEAGILCLLAGLPASAANCPNWTRPTYRGSRRSC